MTNKRTVLRASLLILLVSGAFVCFAWIPGRLTGGGSIFTDTGMRVTHGFELQCQVEGPDGKLITPLPNNLEVNWEGNRFHLESLTTGECTVDPNINSYPPKAPFNTYTGEGLRRYNGEEGARILFKLTDAGEPGSGDLAQFTVFDKSGTVVLSSGPHFLTFGNHHAHK
jgi:hypothetical protein